MIGLTDPVPEVPSLPFTVKRVIALPPFAGAVNAIEFSLSPAVGTGASICAGTVVTVTEEDVVPVAVPLAFFAFTVNVYDVFDANPWNV